MPLSANGSGPPSERTIEALSQRAALEAGVYRRLAFDPPAAVDLQDFNGFTSADLDDDEEGAS